MKKEYDFAQMKAVKNPYAVGMKNKKDPSKEGSKSGGPGSNRQPLAWKAKALPLSYRREHDNYTKI